MPEFIITKGTIKQGRKFLKPGDPISLSAEEAKSIDPEGICLKSKGQFDKEARDLADKSRAAEESSRKLADAAKKTDKKDGDK